MVSWCRRLVESVGHLGGLADQQGVFAGGRVGSVGGLRARPNRRILTTFHVRLGHSGLCANLLQKHRTWRADPHAGSQSLICARCLVGKSATRRGLGTGVQCRYMASSDGLQRLIQEYLQVPESPRRRFESAGGTVFTQLSDGFRAQA